MSPESDYHPPIPDAVWHAAMRWNAPLSDTHASMLLDALELDDAASVLDLGCGWAELLMRAVKRCPTLSGIGVDSDATAIERGRALAVRHGLQDRVTLIEGPADSWAEPAERVLCVGATHIWKDTATALAELMELTRPGGRLLYGDGFLEPEVSPFTAELFPEMSQLAALLTSALEPGWRVLHLSVSDQLEWDEFESSYRAGPERWLLANPDVEDAPRIREWLDGRMREYLNGYRGELGFAWLVLGRS